MKILIACEFSGITRNAFTALGHDVISCDLLETESPGKHYKGNIFDIINNDFDMMIAFPPCTYLTAAAAWRWKDTEQELINSMRFVDKLFSANIPLIAIENPKGYLTHNWRIPNQILSPHNFGSRFRKTTCLWLKNLPPLIYGCQTLNPRSKVNQYGSKHNKPKLRSKICPELSQAADRRLVPRLIVKFHAAP